MTWNLVTGADGFVGQHLVTELVGRGEQVIGAVRRLPPRLTTLSEADAERVHWVCFDLEQRDTVGKLVRARKVDRIFHLAGLSSERMSLIDSVSPLKINVIGTLYLLDEIERARREMGHDPRVLISGSGHAYGSAANRCRPLTEDCPLEPLSPYAVSKASQEMLGLQYHRAHGLSVIVTRSFNHTGPGQQPPFVTAELAAQIRVIRDCGGEGSVKAGNLGVRRDFTDVRDVVRAYILLTELGEAGRVYNVCSARSYAISELLEMLADVAGVRVQVESDPERVRRVDLPEVLGSYARLEDATGWRPEIELRQSLTDLLTSLEAA